MSNVKFNQETFEVTSAKVVASCNGIDKAIANSFETRQAFVAMALAGLTSGDLTLEAIETRIMDDFILSLPANEQDDARDSESTKCVTSLNHCGPYDSKLRRRVGGTIKQVYSNTKRIFAAGNEQAEKVANGESYIQVAKASAPIQQQGKAKADPKPKADAEKTLVSLNDAATALSAYIDGAMADSDKAMEIATNPLVAALMGKLTALEAKVNASLVAKAA